jgi:hypothetical protein
MNYKKIHDDFIEYFKKTHPKDRILKRNKHDTRIQFDSIYMEIHHIIPRSLGGNDSHQNLVEVLPEEHIFLHMLRYKIYSKREDMLAIRFMLNGFCSKSCLGDLKYIITKKIRTGYSWIRTHSAILRKTDGWHTESGRGRISSARKGMIVAKDRDTGEMIGSVENTHKNVISGKWVHHSKGRKITEQELEYRRVNSIGQKNSNASGLSDEYFITKGVEMYNEFGIILSWERMLELSKSRKFKWITSLKSRYNGRGFSGYICELEKRIGIKYLPIKSRIIRPRGISLC